MVQRSKTPPSPVSPVDTDKKKKKKRRKIKRGMVKVKAGYEQFSSLRGRTKKRGGVIKCAGQNQTNLNQEPSQNK